MKPRLVTIRFSHYCEKARWALQRAGVDFDEEFHAPVFHVPAVKRAGSKHSTPVLVFDDHILPDSTDIVLWADAQGAGLLPADPARRAAVLAWEELFDEKLGPHTRRLAYFNIFQTPKAAILPTMRASAGSGTERALLGPLFPLLRFAMRKSMRIDAEGARRSRSSIDAVLEQVEARLADGRPYIEGDTFTAADLTFAALFAPLVGPEAYGAPMPGFLELPDPFRSLRLEMTDRPAGRFTLRLYDSERGVVRGR